MKTNSLDFDAQALREKILDLAMRGKLVKQDPNDEPASVLLEKIKAEKEELVKEKKIKKNKALPEITDEEKPFDIPDSWEWVRLGSIGTLKNGKTPKKEDISDQGSYPYFKVKDMNNNQVYMNNIENFVNEKYINQLMPKDTIIFPKNGGAVLTAKKRILIQDSLVDLNTGGIIPNSNISFKYLFYLFRNLNIKDYVKGSAVPTIDSKKLRETVVPLPPLEEQSRIAAKIAQLFALLCKVESSTQQYAKLQTLLKSKVLDLAMRGKLVEQDPNDEPASVLLEKIKSEKEQLIKEKKIKKSKPLPPISDEEKPFDIPDSWEWTYLKDVANITKLAGFEYTKYIKPNLMDRGVPLFKAKNIQSGKIIDNFENYISEELSDTLVRSQLNRKCLLTPYVGSIGKVAIFSGKYKAHLGSNVGKIEMIKSNGQGMVELFVMYYLQSTYGFQQLIKHLKSTAQPSISITALREVVIPVPSVIEQKRIIDKMKQILLLLK